MANIHSLPLSVSISSHHVLDRVAFRYRPSTRRVSTGPKNFETFRTAHVKTYLLASSRLIYHVLAYRMLRLKIRLNERRDKREILRHFPTSFSHQQDAPRDLFLRVVMIHLSSAKPAVEVLDAHWPRQFHGSLELRRIIVFHPKVSRI